MLMPVSYRTTEKKKKKKKTFNIFMVVIAVTPYGVGKAPRLPEVKNFLRKE